MRWRRRLLVLILAAVAAGLVQRRRSRSTAAVTDPVWPPLTAVAEPAPTPPPAPAWVLPVDGACPEGFPIKANASSGIYHLPGGRFYDRTKPERCYAASADAERDGYRAAKA